MEYPDDLNEWTEVNFGLMRKLFRSATSQTAAKVQPQDEKDVNRTKIINEDDLTNLKIDLSQIKGPDDFLKRM